MRRVVSHLRREPDPRFGPTRGPMSGVLNYGQRALKVFTRGPFARGNGRSRLPPVGGVLVLRPRLPRGNPLLPDLGFHVRLVEHLEAGVGRCVRGDDRFGRVRDRRDAPLPKMSRARRHQSSPFDTGEGGLKARSSNRPASSRLDMRPLLRRDRDAVSAVIATILLVAITVVLAAVLYIMVSGLFTSTGTGPQIIGVAVSKTTDGTNWPSRSAPTRPALPPPMAHRQPAPPTGRPTASKPFIG